MNKCEFCRNSKNVDGKFICGVNISEHKNFQCDTAINRMEKINNKSSFTTPMEKCNYCEFSDFEYDSKFICNGSTRDDCRNALKRMIDIKTNNIQ